MPRREPLVVAILREFREALLGQEAEQMRLMAGRWLTVEAELELRLEALAEQVAELRAAGQAPGVGQLVSLGRFQDLLAAMRREVGEYEAWAGDLIQAAQLDWGTRALANAAEVITAAYVQAGVVPASFNFLPVTAIENMVGLAGDGSPLSLLLREASATAADGILNQLIRSTALGLNPRETARRLREQGLSLGLNRTLTIARTEQLRVYREAGRAQYQSSGVVSGARRLSARDERVCPACLFADGQEYDLGEPLDEHPNGRCTQVPIVSGLPPVTWQEGLAWYRAQDAGTQERILGAGAYAAWRDGAVRLEDFISRRENATWGASLQVTPLKALIP